MMVVVVVLIGGGGGGDGDSNGSNGCGTGVSDEENDNMMLMPALPRSAQVNPESVPPLVPKSSQYLAKQALGTLARPFGLKHCP